MTRAASILKPPIVADRVRKIGVDGFAFMPNLFLRDGFFASLSLNERSLYFLLVLAGDRRGLSYYHYDTICSLLEIPIDDYIDARNSLLKKDLVAFDGTRFQVLSLPERPIVRTASDSDSDVEQQCGEHSAIRHAILSGLHRDKPDSDSE